MRPMLPGLGRRIDPPQRSEEGFRPTTAATRRFDTVAFVLAAVALAVSWLAYSADPPAPTLMRTGTIVDEGHHDPTRPHAVESAWWPGGEALILVQERAVTEVSCTFHTEGGGAFEVDRFPERQHLTPVGWARSWRGTPDLDGPGRISCTNQASAVPVSVATYVGEDLARFDAQDPVRWRAAIALAGPPLLTLAGAAIIGLVRTARAWPGPFPAPRHRRPGFGYDTRWAAMGSVIVVGLGVALIGSIMAAPLRSMPSPTTTFKPVAKAGSLPDPVPFQGTLEPLEGAATYDWLGEPLLLRTTSSGTTFCVATGADGRSERLALSRQRFEELGLLERHLMRTGDSPQPSWLEEGFGWTGRIDLAAPVRLGCVGDRRIEVYAGVDAVRDVFRYDAGDARRKVHYTVLVVGAITAVTAVLVGSWWWNKLARWHERRASRM